MSLWGCGGGGQSGVLGPKDGAPVGLNQSGPKNAANPEVTGTFLNLAQADESSEQCQGLPPILPDPPPPDFVAPLPVDGFSPVTESEVAATPIFSFQTYSYVVGNVQRAYRDLDLTSAQGTRVLVDTINVACKGFSGGRSANVTLPPWLGAFRNLTLPEKLVVLQYPVEALACQVAPEQANQMTEYVYPGHSAEEDDWRGNAFRHMYWNMLMCYHGSIEFAKAMATAHEVPKSGEGAEDTKRHNMDLHNNAVGRLAYFLGRPDIHSNTDLLSVLFSYTALHPYEYFDGRPDPPTESPVYLKPPPDPPERVAVVVSESSVTGSPEEVGFFRGGTPRYWWESTYYGLDGHMFWTYSNGNNTDNYGLWRPNIARAGRYEVLAFIPGWFASTKHARYVIHHAGGFSTVEISQYDIYDKWASLGTYDFDGGTASTVELSDNTGERVKTQWIGFDAMQWVPR